MSEASSIVDLIGQIAAESSRNEKERLVKRLMNDPIGKFTVGWAYDPFITFGLTPVRQQSNGDGLALAFRPALVEKLLRELSQRKLTGNAAQREVAEVMQALEPAGAELLFLILSKDLKCGIAATTINSVEPGFIPTFAVMRAHKFEEKRMKAWPQIVEPKLDGYRFTFLCRNGSGGFFSRSGIRQPSADHLVEPMIATALNALQKSIGNGTDLHKVLSQTNDNRGSLNFMVDGEMIVDGSFAETGALRRKDETADGAVFNIFDLMSYDDFNAVGSVGKTYMERRKMVEEFVSHALSPAITKTPRYFANSVEEIHKLYESFRARGLEGAMVKNPDGLYDKKKSYGWLKIKAEESEDLVVVGAFPGEPNTKYEHCLGGLIVHRVHGSQIIPVRVGGGFSDEQREELWKLYVNDRDGVGTGNLLLGRMVEVIYHEVTPDGSLRHPRFKCFRDDKAGEIESKEAA